MGEEACKRIVKKQRGRGLGLRLYVELGVGSEAASEAKGSEPCAWGGGIHI